MPFSVSPDDWKWFNKKVPKVLEEYYDKGYAIVIFRYAGSGARCGRAYSCVHLECQVWTNLANFWHHQHAKSGHSQPENLLFFLFSNQNSIKSAVDGKAAANVTKRIENALSQVGSMASAPLHADFKPRDPRVCCLCPVELVYLSLSWVRYLSLCAWIANRQMH